MAQQLNTLLNHTYEVQSPVECTVRNAAGAFILTAYPGTPVQFVADGQPVTLSVDSATLLPVSGKTRMVDIVAAVPTGEAIEHLNEATLTIKHATWYENETQTTLQVQPSAWKNEVMTCYLKTLSPVVVSGVQWLYGEPAMMDGFTFVVALQQVDSSTIIANLAYTLKQ
jgi:hypothetical protein